MRRLAILMVFLLSACYRNPPEVNTIVFEDSVREVADSLKTACSLMQGIWETAGISNYLFGDGDELWIGEVRIDSPDIILADTLRMLSRVQRNQRERLQKVITFLHKNHLDGCFWDQNILAWSFHYRFRTVKEEGDRRYVVALVNPAIEKNVRTAMTIIERRGDLALVADKGVRIR
jgi:hypothetical protein